MVSKTRMQSLVREFRVDEAMAGLHEDPTLIEYRDKRGRNWLHLCASVDVIRKKGLKVLDSVRLAEALLAEGMDIDAPAFIEGNWHATPMWHAVARGRNLPLVKFLLDRGASPEHCLWAAAFHEDLDMLTVLIDFGANLEAVAEQETPLLGAVKYSKFKAAAFLLEAGADPNFRDVRGMTALHYMLKKNSDKRHFRMFVEHGARGDIANAAGETATSILLRKRDPAFHGIGAALLTR